jgi:uncharacterized protein (TIGR04255 family)
MMFKYCSTRKGVLDVPLDVSNVDRTLLAQSPLTSVVCQVRFDSTPRAGEARLAQDLRTRLGGEEAFPQLEAIAEASLSVSVGPNAPPVSQQINATGWRMASGDGGRIVSLLPSSVSFEVTQYSGWPDFAAQFDAVIDAIAECVQPVFEQRLGLRYINQLTVPEVRSPEGWRGYVDDAFVGLASHAEIDNMIIFARQQAVLQLDDETRCTLNHGFAPDEAREQALTYVLDFDVAREGTRLFDTAGLHAAAERFNAYALRLFQISTTAQLRDLIAK